MKFAVMLEARAGTRRLVHDNNRAYWEDNLHTVTWVIEDSLAAARAVIDEVQAGRSRDLRRVWVEERTA